MTNKKNFLLVLALSLGLTGLAIAQEAQKAPAAKPPVPAIKHPEKTSADTPPSHAMRPEKKTSAERAQKLREHLAALVKRVKTAPALKPPRTQKEEIRDLAQLLTGVQKMFTQPFSAQVKMSKQVGFSLFPRENFAVDYQQEATQAKPAGFSIKSGKASMTLDPIAIELMTAFLKNPTWIHSVADIEELKVNKANPTMAKVERKFAVNFKIPLRNIKSRVIVGLAANNAPVLVEVINTELKERLVYEFEQAAITAPQAPAGNPNDNDAKIAIPQV